MQLRSAPKAYVELIYETTDSLAGKTHTPRLTDITPELNGYPLHVLGLIFRMTPKVTKVAATMASACPGFRAFNTIENVALSVGHGDHMFIRNMSGMGLRHDSIRIRGKEFNGSYQDLPDADATNAAAQEVELFVPFVHRRNVAGAEFDGAVPIQAFSDSDFSFSIGGAGAFGFAGVTLISASVQVFAVLMPYHKLLMPTAWQIREENHSETVIKRDGDGYYHYLDIVDRTTNADATLGGIYPTIQLTIDNAVMKNRAPFYWSFEQRIAALQKEHSMEEENEDDPTYIPLIPNQFDMITRQPRGLVKVEVAGRTSTSTTLIQRTQGFRGGKYQDSFLRKFGTSTAQLAQDPNARIEVQTARGSAARLLNPSLCAALRWSNMPFAALREGAAFRE